MELDDLKSAWQGLDRRLAAQHALNLELLRERKLDTARSRLRPLVWGQTVQTLLAVVLVVVAAGFWSAHRSEPHLLAAGLILQIYGIAVIIAGARTISLAQSIDYAAPVLVIQRQVAALGRWYGRSGMAVGLPWWLLWMPFMMMVFMILFGADMYANAPSVIWSGTAVGVIGLFATWVFHRWAHQPERPRLARMVTDSVTGRSILRARALVEELARFEAD